MVRVTTLISTPVIATLKRSQTQPVVVGADSFRLLALLELLAPSPILRGVGGGECGGIGGRGDDRGDGRSDSRGDIRGDAWGRNAVDGAPCRRWPNTSGERLWFVVPFA